MATKIEWVKNPDGTKGETWNPVTGCTKVSTGCKHCYAERMSKRLAGRYGYPADDPFRVTLHPDRLDQPLRWRKPRRVFVCSMSDFFHPHIPLGFQAKMFSIMRRCPQHTFQILTKRIEQLALFDEVCGWPQLPNVWLGITAENQETANERIPELLKIPAAVRFVSLEPLLGSIDFIEVAYAYKAAGVDGLTLAGLWDHLHWVIAGCESGPGRRETPENWFRDLRDQCEAASVPFFLKQMDRDGKIEKLPEFDGRVWAEFPVVE